MTDLIERVAERLRGLPAAAGRQIVAVSGGLDSMVLLDVMRRLSPRFGWSLIVAHLNHRLRGRESRADEALVRKIARHSGLPMVVGSADILKRRRLEKVSLEMAAREARHSFLTATARRRRASAIVLAHHADDQVELFFLRLFRGSGPDGLGGMRAISSSPFDGSIFVLRPLLDETKAELLEYALSRKIQFREDATNRQHEIQRNRIRGELLPTLRRRYAPFSDAAIARTMRLLQDESDFISRAAAEWLAASERPAFNSLHPALQRRCIQTQLFHLGIKADFDLIEQLRQKPERRVAVAALEKGRKKAAEFISRSAAGEIRREPLAPRQEPASAAKRFRVGKKSGTVAFQGLRVSWQIQARRGNKLARNGAKVEEFDADKVGPTVILRHWRPGDRFQPIGMASAVKLQDFFVNVKVPRVERHKLVVAEAASGGIFWVEGARISEVFKLKPGTIRRLQWRWDRA
ncbi:MAG TPA: tRNA lysidine(34) synthetase TilS [Verrucomicrobiae bacterium]|nr:tRNA lysidine(34) synthetase TilS [Verrucomicrobiae bacterium]